MRKILPGLLIKYVANYAGRIILVNTLFFLPTESY
jgi:hypothetical protein